jgi:hypothetical protein
MTNQAPTKPQNGATAPLQPADQTPATPAEERALAFAIKIYALSPEGFVVEITSAEQTRPAVFISQMCDGLGRLHFMPVDPFAAPNIDVDVAGPAAAAGAAAAASGGEATWIKGEGGAPPKCSLHGAAKWVEGTYKPDHQRAGQHFEFWGCKVNGCRPKGDPK